MKKKGNRFKYLLFATFMAIVIAFSSLGFVSLKSVATADDYYVKIENQILTSVEGDFVGSNIGDEQDALDYLNNFKKDFGYGGENLEFDDDNFKFDDKMIKFPIYIVKGIIYNPNKDVMKKVVYDSIAKYKAEKEGI